MPRTTIDFGIDLGTTNSAVSVINGVDTLVIANSKQASVTPSAVWIDRRGRLRVGEDAKERFETDFENCDREFKRRMGMGQKGAKHFVEANRTLLPEELSAEVLKSLRADVQTVRGEDMNSAVITVPAAFELPQCDATMAAAKLAGFSQSPLLQEPVAAAMAYGFQNLDQDSRKKPYWLVYDFGGGTFDAAIMQMQDGILQVVNHAGDNHLGGALIDWDIVDKLLIPHLLREFRLTDFRRGNDRWRAAIAYLKGQGERAKIEVSRTRRPALVAIDFSPPITDDRGARVETDFELTPEALANLCAPYMERALNLCTKALREKGLTGQHMEKVLMVGGTSLMPWLREHVQSQLRAPLDFSIDPMTVVARGAAIFASTQLLPTDMSQPVPEGTFRLELQYSPTGMEDDPDFEGRVHHPKGAGMKGYTLELTETKSQWKSGKVRIADNGLFETVLHAEPGRCCEYQIALYDPRGARIAVTPNECKYTIGADVGDVKLTNSVGIAMANNQMDVLFKKGQPLPLRGRTDHRTAKAFQRGSGDELIRIPLVEGETVGRADRNRLFGNLKIPTSEIRRDLPAGSDVEISVEIDESRRTTIRAFIPILGQEFEVTVNMDGKFMDAHELQEEMSHERQRLQSLRDKANMTSDIKARQAIILIDREDTLGQVERLLSAAAGDPTEAETCRKRLGDLRISVDQIEDALELPVLLLDAESQLSEARNLVNQFGDARDKARFQTLERELRDALKSADADTVRRHTEEVHSFGVQVLLRQDGFWVAMFTDLQSQRNAMRDPALADRLFSQGQRALAANDIEGLKAVDRQLLDLLPQEIRKKVGFGGDTTK